MGEAKRRKDLGLSPRDNKNPNKEMINSNQINKTLNKYPYLPFVLGFLVLGILIFDLVNYYS